ncbi:MAG: ribbon-helix-helix domain-containing protein [Promethearchaeota archaeon]
MYTYVVSFEKDADTMTEDMMIRVPRELKNRFENLAKKNSWKGFASFVREAIRFHLDHHEEIERGNGS